MGGLGSGRPSGSGRSTVEACRSIDVNRLHREGCLRAGWVGGWQWKRDSENVASINLRTEVDRLHLSYRVRISGGEWEDVTETVRIVRMACRFGGTRPYFICPGVVNGIACGRRVAKLHGPGRYFLCRNCYRLAHASQGESEVDRALRRANKIRQRLGGSPGMDEPFPPKPKGMWRRTYEQLRERTFEAETIADEAFAIQVQRLLARGDKLKGKKVSGMTEARWRSKHRNRKMWANRAVSAEALCRVRAIAQALLSFSIAQHGFHKSGPQDTSELNWFMR
jgi:hypothetical protein